jgi:hypothetical protein
VTSRVPEAVFRIPVGVDSRAAMTLCVNDKTRRRHRPRDRPRPFLRPRPRRAGQMLGKQRLWATRRRHPHQPAHPGDRRGHRLSWSPSTTGARKKHHAGLRVPVPTVRLDLHRTAPHSGSVPRGARGHHAPVERGRDRHFARVRCRPETKSRRWLLRRWLLCLAVPVFACPASHHFDASRFQAGSGHIRAQPFRMVHLHK